MVSLIDVLYTIMSSLKTVVYDIGHMSHTVLFMAFA